MKQYDLWGEIREPPKPVKSVKVSRKFKTMQELHGYTEGQTCKTCIHSRSIRFAKVYWKCELWNLSHSSATDIRLKDKACGQWKQKLINGGRNV